MIKTLTRNTLKSSPFYRGKVAKFNRGRWSNGEKKIRRMKLEMKKEEVEKKNKTIPVKWIGIGGNRGGADRFSGEEKRGSQGLQIERRRPFLPGMGKNVKEQNGRERDERLKGVYCSQLYFFCLRFYWKIGYYCLFLM